MRLSHLLGILTLSLPVFGQDYFSDNFIKEELIKFEQSPKTFMQMPIVKKYSQNKRSNFIKALILGKKIEIRNKIKNIASNKSFKSFPLENDQIEGLLQQSNIVRNIYQIQQKELTSGKVSNQPWSDDYWPIYKGVLGNRYAIDEFDEIIDWESANNYVQQRPAFEIFDTFSNDQINKLSPAEKYDLLIGRDTFYLTQHGWMQGKMYNERYGSVESWMGICHGWAPASYMYKRPSKKVTVKAFDGKTDITFYPTDIKALASLLWANTRSPSLFVGGRCTSTSPKLDINGRIIEQDCLDNNPSTFHLALVNKVGRLKESFVMDATYDYEVWNHPVNDYKFKYFNPITKTPVNSIQEAIVKIDDHKKDVFKKYRSKNATHLIGIALEVGYGIETAPVQRDEDSKTYDSLNYAYYQYDLELDHSGNIIGGEWYKNRHPDFLWTPPSGTRVVTYGDYYILSDSNWNGKETLPEQWKQLANIIASKTGSPLAKIVESLIELSNK